MKSLIKTFLTFLWLLCFGVGSAQDFLPKDTLHGQAKRIREKVIFLTDIENPQLLYNSDYGHLGFQGAEYTKKHFRNIWFSKDWCYYINYERLFDKQGNIIKDTWFSKSDSVFRQFRNVYNDNNQLIKTIDSSYFRKIVTTYAYSNAGDINIRRYYGKKFIDIYKKMINGKISVEKEFYPFGVNEYQYFYNDREQLKYRLFKNPQSWKHFEDGTDSYGVHDSIPTIRKIGLLILKNLIYI